MTAIEHYQGRAGSLAIIDDRTEHTIKWAAKTIRSLDKRLREMEDQAAAEVLATSMAFELWQSGFEVTARNAKRMFHLISGEAVESSEFAAAKMRRAGLELHYVETSAERAVVRARRPDSDHWEVIEATPAEPEAYGLLDEKVQQWTKEGGKWRVVDEIVIRRDGRPLVDLDKLPEWAKKQIAQGKVKRNEAWFRSRPDMLLWWALRRVARRVAPDLVADAYTGAPPPARQAPAVDDETGEILDGPVDDVADEEIADAEVVEEDPKPRQRQILDDHLDATDEPEPAYADDDPERPFGADE